MQHTAPLLPALLLLASCAGFQGDLILAPGTYKHDVTGTTSLDDSSEASFVRMRAEGFAPEGLGGGIALDAIGSDDDLFDRGAAYAGGDLFLYGGYRFGAEDVRVPVRLGLLVSGRTLELKDSSDTELNWSSLGVGFEVAPQIRLLGSANGFSLWAFGDFRMGVMGTEIEVETSLGAPTWDTASLLWGAHMGLRGQVQQFQFSLGYLGSLFAAAESDSKGGITLRESSDTFNGFAIGLGLAF